MFSTHFIDQKRGGNRLTSNQSLVLIKTTWARCSNDFFASCCFMWLQITWKYCSANCLCVDWILIILRNNNNASLPNSRCDKIMTKSNFQWCVHPYIRSSHSLITSWADVTLCHSTVWHCWIPGFNDIPCSPTTTAGESLTTVHPILWKSINYWMWLIYQLKNHCSAANNAD